MKRSRYIVIVVVALVVSGWIAPRVKGAEAAGPESTDAAWVKAMKANSVDAVAACYASDAVGWFPGETEVKGQKAIRESYERMLKDFTVKDAGTSDTTYKTFGKTAVSWGKWWLTVVEKATGKTQEWKGRSSEVLEKRVGRWVYVVDHASEEPPPKPAPAPPETEKK